VKVCLQEFKLMNDPQVLLVSPLWNVIDQKNRTRKGLRLSPNDYYENIISLSAFLSEGFSRYKGNLYWGLYKTKSLRDVLKKHPLPALPHNDLFTLAAVMSEGRVLFINKVLFTKAEYFSDARKKHYSAINRFIDICTHPLIYFRIVANIILPLRLWYLIRISTLYYQYMYSLFNNGVEGLMRARAICLYSSWLFFLHLLPNDITSYKRRTLVFGGHSYP
jgi:hypothetical protein